jgi:hypothetical protein
VRMLIGSNLAAHGTGVDALPSTVNYFRGNDPAHWRSRIPTYAKVQYSEVYSGIGLGLLRQSRNHSALGLVTSLR